MLKGCRYSYWKNPNYRYDKLYMGNDVFFYNDKSGRVERLHANMEGGGVYNRSLSHHTQLSIKRSPNNCQAQGQGHLRVNSWLKSRNVW